MACTGTVDKGMGMVTDSKKVISIHTHGTRICVPSRFMVPVLNTTHWMTENWKSVISKDSISPMLIPNPLSLMREACNKVVVLSRQCNFLDNEFIPLNLVTFEFYLLDIFLSVTSYLFTEQIFMILELAGVKRNVIENVVSFCSIL